MLEGEGESMLEIGENGLCEVGGGGGEVIEEEGLSWGEKKPRYIEKSERERGRRHGPRRWRDGAAFHHRDFGGRSHFEDGGGGGGGYGRYLPKMPWLSLLYKRTIMHIMYVRANLIFYFKSY